MKEVVGDEGFVLNECKTRVLRQHQRQQVTGVVVNDKLQAPRSLRRALRQHVHYIKTYGLASHMQHRGIRRANFLLHLEGMAAHIISIDRTDKDALAALELVRGLTSDGDLDE